jgi:hypothetical protein
MIEIETRLLEIMDWDEEAVTKLYDDAVVFLQGCKHTDRSRLERDLVAYLRKRTTDEAARLVLSILDQNIRHQMRIIEE